MGRSQVERNRRARGRGRGDRKERVAAPPIAVKEQQQVEESTDNDDLDARAEQLLSYAIATSTAASQFQQEQQDPFFMTEAKDPKEMEQQMKILSQRLEAVPLKDRLRLPDHILEELYGKQQPSKPTVIAESKTEHPAEDNESDGGDDLDSWLDSVIQ